MNKKSNNQKTTSANTKNKLMPSKDNLTIGREKPNKLTLKLKEFKANFSNMFKKKIDFQTCSRPRMVNMRL